MNFYQIVFLFFAYSFLGWVGEVLFTAVVHRKYQDRGVLSGPLCLLYGVGGLVITFALGDIREGWFFLLVFSAVYATVIEWIGGHILEYTTHTRWWDYSAMPFNLDGYVCLGASLTWGALGVVVLKWGNPLLLALYSLVPRGIWVVVLLAALVVFCVDLVGTLLAMAGLRYRWHAAAAVENRLANLTVRGGMWILDHVERRMAKAHPALTFVRPKRQQTDTFAAGCSPYKIILLFFIGAFLGDITETICWAVRMSTCAVFSPRSFSVRCSGTTARSRSTWAGASTCCTASSGALRRLPGSRCCSRRSPPASRSCRPAAAEC